MKQTEWRRRRSFSFCQLNIFGFRFLARQNKHSEDVTLGFKEAEIHIFRYFILNLAKSHTQLVHQLDPEWNISTSVWWIAVKMVSDLRVALIFNHFLKKNGQTVTKWCPFIKCTQIFGWLLPFSCDVLLFLRSAWMDLLELNSDF